MARDIVDLLDDCTEDPMRAGHAEVPKALLLSAKAEIVKLRAAEMLYARAIEQLDARVYARAIEQLDARVHDLDSQLANACAALTDATDYIRDREND